MKETPFVSVITPCRNEESYISRYLNSIAGSAYPRDNLEVLVIDGRSTDNTKAMIDGYVKEYPFIKFLDNPGKMQTLATNMGIKAAQGDVIIRMDAHAEYPRNYIPKLVDHLTQSGADCVGGCCETVPGDDTETAKAISLALSHPFGVGNAHFRTGVKESRYVDTVPFGCYKKEVFGRVGLFNENLDRTDDLEFNLRLKNRGGRLLLIPDVRSRYYARRNLRELFKQNYANGFWILYSVKFVRLPFSWRHVVPLLFVGSLLCSLLLALVFKPALYVFSFIGLLYVSANIYFSARIALKNSITCFLPLVLSFATLHFSYGIGSLGGILRLLTDKIRRRL